MVYAICDQIRLRNRCPPHGCDLLRALYVARLSFSADGTNNNNNNNNNSNKKTNEADHEEETKEYPVPAHDNNHMGAMSCQPRRSSSKKYCRLGKSKSSKVLIHTTEGIKRVG